MAEIIDFAMTDGYDWNLIEDENGFIDLDLTCNHQVVSGLIYTRLLDEVDYSIINDDEVSQDIKAQVVRRVVLQTYGVSNVDMSGFFPQEDNGTLILGRICPEINCANKVECEPL